MENEEQAAKIKAENEDEADPVVKEIPVYVSKRLEKRLYLFNYPSHLMKKDPKDELNVRRGFFKPKNQEVKLEVEIDVLSTNFDNERAEYLAQLADKPSDSGKKDAKKEKFFENDLVDKVLLTSTKMVKDPSKYAVGAFNGRELHLTSLEGILQLRPSFPYLDKAVKIKKKDQEADSDEDYEPGPSTAQQVTVKFKQAENERWKKIRENSYKSLQQRSAEEPWIECSWHKESSAISKTERLKLYTENLDSTNQAKDLLPEEYVRVLIPEDQEEYVVKPSMPSHVISLRDLKAQPLPEQCRLLLKDAKIIQFQQMKMLLVGSEGLTSEALLKALPKVASLVQGNWIVKSEVLYPEKTYSAVSGVPAEIMCRARDYVLHLFTKTQYVERRKVSSVIRIPAEEIKEIFTGIAKLRQNKVWELALPTDQEFVDANPEIVQKQNCLWEQRARQLSEYLIDNNSTTTAGKDKKRRKSKSVSEDGATISNKIVKNGPPSLSSSSLKDCNNFSSDNDSGTEKKSPVAARKNKTAKHDLNVKNDPL